MSTALIIVVVVVGFALYAIISAFVTGFYSSYFNINPQEGLAVGLAGIAGIVWPLSVTMYLVIGVSSYLLQSAYNLGEVFGDWLDERVDV